MASVHKATAGEMRGALKRYYAQPECAVVFEVAQSTGHNANRHLDAVAMELWPSRGLAIHGIEIKVDRGDWRREKADPTKAEEIARFCDDFFIAAPKGVVPIDELPAAWGLLELMPEGRINPTKPAAKTAAQPIDRAFLAALLRATSRPVDPDSLDSMLAVRQQQLEAQFDERVKREAAVMSKVREAGNARWAELCAVLGRDPETYTFSESSVIDAVKAVHAAGVAASWSGLKSLIGTLEDTLRKVREAAGEMHIDVEQPKPKRRSLSSFTKAAE
jgi:hypothetical protein